MFFIGILGVNQKQKPLDIYNNAVCPSCGALTRFEVFKTYSYFHIFFIPIFRWNVKYFVKPACCGSIYELDPNIGKQYENENHINIKNEHLHPVNQYLPYKTCPNCSAKFESSYSFCPHCGEKL
jgi:DNA-directed RNA polymerase subunit RPC12/RpoP